ncbi:hypothetical protein Pint_02507 [Pistacia integerrima]|uniref:Uncharacterized protein n=1 Tax=Pistacia integerrima TaxID=434235 RepID=A0ACC0ZIX5_9ROSI|nr:hypothetical protein Pint_02507 [Pistacia integerrima]
MDKKKKNEVIRLERESVIPILKAQVVAVLSLLIENPDHREEFAKLCKRLMYAFFDPVTGPDSLKQHRISPKDADEVEMEFLKHLFRVMDKSNFKLATTKEIDLALSGQYLLNLPITVNESKLDKKLLKRYFEENHHNHLPDFADKIYGTRRLEKYFCQPKRDSKKDDEIRSEDDPDDLYVERICLENMELSFANFLSKITIQEPTFDRIIVVYRPASKGDEPDRTIYVKHIKNIPMVDLEIVLPEKKNPGLTPTDWVKFLGSAVVGLVKEVIISFFILMEQEKATTRDSEGRYSCARVKRGNEIIGTSTEELVLKAKKSVAT